MKGRVGGKGLTSWFSCKVNSSSFKEREQKDCFKVDQLFSLSLPVFAAG